MNECVRGGGGGRFPAEFGRHAPSADLTLFDPRSSPSVPSSIIPWRLRVILRILSQSAPRRLVRRAFARLALLRLTLACLLFDHPFG